MDARTLWRDRLFRAAVAWIGVGVVLAVLTSPLGELLAPVMLPLLGGFALLGVGLVAAAVFRLAHPQTRVAAMVAALWVLGLVPAFAAAAWLGGWQQLARVGDEAAFRLRFARLESRYAALVPILARDTVSEGPQTHEGTRYLISAGPPARLAFPQPGGILDNWEGIVYDPSGEVAQARGWRYDGGRQEFTAPPDVRTLFGGDLVACEHLRGPWYRCWFT